MKTTIPAAAVLIFCFVCGPRQPGQGAVPEPAKDQLRRLVQFPPLLFEPDLSFNPGEGFVVLSERRQGEVASLLGEFKGDSSDAERQFRLGRLHESRGDRAKARQAYARSAALYSQKVEWQPGNGPLLARFAQALAASGQFERAESTFWEAVRLVPEDWLAWAAWGDYLESKAIRLLLPFGSRQAFRPEQLLRGILRHPPAGERVIEAEAALREATEAFDRSVAAAPDQADAYFRRGMHQVSRGYLLYALHSLRGGTFDFPSPLRAMFSSEALDDFQQARALAPDNYQVIGTAILFEAAAAVARQQRTGIEGAVSWSALPDRTRQSVRSGLTQLETLGRHHDHRMAAGALETLATVQLLILDDFTGAIANLNSAVHLDPAREQAWEKLMATLSRTGKLDEMLAAGRRLLDQSTTSRSRILLANAHYLAGHYNAAERQLGAALRLDQNHFDANLAMASTLLKSPHSPAWARAREFLAQADRTRNKTREQLIQLALTLSIYFGLNDDLDEARRLVRTILAADQENPYARQIAAALER